MFLSTNTIFGIERMFAGVNARLNFPISFPFPYSWNKETQVFSVKPGFKIWWIVPFTIYLLASALQVVLQIIKPNMKVWERIQSCYFVLGYAVMALYFTRFHHIHAEDVCYFLNQIIIYEKQRNYSEYQIDTKFWRNRESRIVVLVGNFLDDSFRLLVLMVPVVAAYLPESPWNPLAALVVLVPSEYTEGWIFGIATYLEYYLFWRIFMDVCIVSYVVNFLLSLFALKCMILEFERSVQLVKENIVQLKDTLVGF